jgi:hypothetical protein
MRLQDTGSMTAAARSCGAATVLMLALAACGAPAAGSGRQAQPTVAPPSMAAALAAAPAGEDPALTRLRLLHRLDADIDEAAALAHLSARLALDEIMPLPYLGVDAEPVEGGLRLAHVYPLTAAESAGLKPGDVLVALGGAATLSKATLGTAIRSHGVADTVELLVLRDGAELRLPAKLGPRPEEDEDEAEQFPDLDLKPKSTTRILEFDFEHPKPWVLDQSFESELGGHGEPPSWVIDTWHDGQVLRQDSDDPTGIRFPLLIVRDARFADVGGRVKFRFAGGKVDRAAGLVLRYRNRFDYYVARVNAAEGDLRIFRVANGARVTLPGGRVEAPCDDDRWHVLEFRAVGSTLTATFDGTATATACDSWFLDGGAGLWTKSDSITEFDDLRLEPLGG